MVGSRVSNTWHNSLRGTREECKPLIGVSLSFLISFALLSIRLVLFRGRGQLADAWIAVILLWFLEREEMNTVLVHNLLSEHFNPVFVRDSHKPRF